MLRLPPVCPSGAGLKSSRFSARPSRYTERAYVSCTTSHIAALATRSAAWSTAHTSAESASAMACTRRWVSRVCARAPYPAAHVCRMSLTAAPGRRARQARHDVSRNHALFVRWNDVDAHPGPVGADHAFHAHRRAVSVIVETKAAPFHVLADPCAHARVVLADPAREDHRLRSAERGEVRAHVLARPIAE